MPLDTRSRRKRERKRDEWRGREHKQLQNIKNAKTLQVYNGSEYYVYAMQENCYVFYTLNYLQLF